MTIKAKVIGSLVGVLCLFVGVSVLSYYRGSHTNERLALVNEAYLPLFRQVVQLQTNLSGLSEDMRRYYFRTPRASSSESSSFSRMVRDIYPYIIQKRFITIDRILEKKDTRGLPAFPKEFKEALDDTRKEFDGILKATETEDFEARTLRLKGLLIKLGRRVEEECKSLTLAVQNENREGLFTGLILSSFMALGGILTIVFSYRVLNPLPLLISSVKKIADGDFHQSLKVKASDESEVAILAREYNRMLEALRDRDKKIQDQQQELLKSEKLAAIGQLSAEVVHEIRNPLNAINLNIDWLQSEIKTEDLEIEKTFQSITREIERLGQITESYLVRAKVSTSDSQKAPVNALLQEVLEFEKGLNKEIQIETKFWPEELYVRADRGKLRQAFINIIKNAKEAMPAGGALNIETELRKNTFEVSIRDSGCGMNEVTRRKAQEPFFSTKTNGTGIGLSVTKNIVEEAQGSLSFESELGQGTTVRMQFPV